MYYLFFMGFCLKNLFMVLLWWSKVIFKAERSLPRSKTKWPPGISRSTMIVQQMKPETSIIPHFRVILTGQPTFLVLLLWLKVIFKVKKSISRSNEQNYHFQQIKLGTCVIPLFSWDFFWKILLWYYFVDPRSFARSKGHLQGQKCENMII